MEWAASPAKTPRARSPLNTRRAKPGCRQQGRQSKAGQRQRVAGRERQRTKQILHHRLPAACQRAEQAAVSRAIPPKLGGGFGHRALQRDRRAVIEGMGHRRRGVNPLHPVLLPAAGCA